DLIVVCPVEDVDEPSGGVLARDDDEPAVRRDAEGADGSAGEVEVLPEPGMALAAPEEEMELGDEGLCGLPIRSRHVYPRAIGGQGDEVGVLPGPREVDPSHALQVEERDAGPEGPARNENLGK